MSALLEFVWFKDLDNWSVKSYLNDNILKSQFNLEVLGGLITPRQEKVKKNDYKNDIDLVKKISFKDGVIHLREEKKSGMDMYKLYPDDLLVSKINFHQGALAINEFEKILLTSTHYQPYIVNLNIDKAYLTFVLRSKLFQNYLFFLKSDGIKTEATFNFIKTLKIPLPSLEIQQQLVKNYQDKLNLAKQQEQQAQQKEQEIETYLYQELGIELPQEEKQNKDILQFVSFKSLQEWGVSKQKSKLLQGKYDFISMENCCNNFRNGVNFNKSQFGKGIKFVNIKDVYTEKYVDLKSLDKIDITDNKVEQNLLFNNDLVFVRSSVKYEGVGFPSLIKLNNENEKIVFCGFVIKCSVNINIIEPDFLLYILRSNLYRDIVVEKSNKSTITNIAQPALKNLQVPLPPLKIQNKIATHIQTLKNEIQTLKQQSEQNQKLALSEFEAEIFNAS